MKFAQEAGANVVSSTHIAFHQLGHAFNFVVFNQVLFGGILSAVEVCLGAMKMT